MTTLNSSGHLGEMLVRVGLLTDAQLAEAIRDQRARPSYVPLGRILVERKFVTRAQIDLLLKSAGKRPRLGELLVSSGHITAAQLAHGLERQRALGVPLGQVLVRLGYVTEEAMRQTLALQMNMRVIARMLDRGTRREL